MRLVSSLLAVLLALVLVPAVPGDASPEARSGTGAEEVAEAVRRARADAPTQNVFEGKLDKPREGLAPPLVEEGLEEDHLARRMASYQTSAREAFEAGRFAASSVRTGETFAESESTPGQNDNPDQAEYAPVAQGTQATIRGELAAASVSELVPSTEDDGSIPLARSVRLSDNDAAAIAGYIGDGPHGYYTGDGSGDFDAYAVELSAGDFLDVEVYGDTYLDAVLIVYDASGNIVDANDDTYGYDPAISYHAESAGTYYVFVTSYNSYPSDPFDSGSGNGSYYEDDYSVVLARNLGDMDWFRFNARAGDVLSFDVSMGDAAPTAAIAGYAGGSWEIEQIGLLPGDLLGLPSSTPLPHDGVVTLTWVVPRTGTFAVGLTGGAGSYTADLARVRPALTDVPETATQKVYLDFDGHSLNPYATFGAGRNETVSTSPLASFLPGWGLDDSHLPAVRDAIRESFSIDMNHLRGDVNGDRDATGIDGQYDVEIMTSTDGPMPDGATRVVVGGTSDEVGIDTVGIASSLDVGNFRQDDTVLVLLDAMSGDPGVYGSDSLNYYSLEGGKTIIDLIGQGVGAIGAHEVGHTLGNYHTEPDSHEGAHPSIMEPGGRMWVIAGAGSDFTYGNSDDVRARFVEALIDLFSGNGIGNAHSPAITAFGLATGNASFPFAPGHVTATATGPENVTVDWTGGFNATSFKVTLKEVGGSGEYAASVTSSPAKFEGLEPQTTYRASVVAANSAGSINGDSRPRVTTRARQVFVLGGEVAVSRDVETSIGDVTQGTVARFAGADRFETAADAVTATWPNGAETVFLATGGNFPDALAGAAAAAKIDAPILLTATSVLPDATREALANLAPSKLIILGGTNAIANSVVDEAKQAAGGSVSVQRVAGASRFETAADVVNQFFDTADTVYIATGLNFPDALAGAASAGVRGAPMLLVHGGIPTEAADAINRLGATKAVVLGGTVAVPSSIENDLRNLDLSVQRLSGVDRYDTAKNIVTDGWPHGAGTIYVATGRDFPDALAGAAVAARSGSPVVLTDTYTLVDSTEAALQYLTK